MTKVKQKAEFSNQTIYVGIDVHLNSWNISLYYNQQYLRSFNQPAEPQALLTFLHKEFPGAKYQCAYEAGFCGYWIHRTLTQNGIECIVVNAADVPQTDKGMKSKTDKNDSKRIGAALQAGILTPIYIPSEEVEADRQLVRCNERLTNDLIRYKSRIKGLLYQLGIDIPNRFSNANWSNLFIQWLKSIHFRSPSSRMALDHLLKMVESIRAEKLSVLKDIRALLLKDRYKNVASCLLSVPGIGPITAITLLTEIDDINRFKSFEKLNSFVGFCPSLFSSGEKDYKGSMTNRHHRRLRSLLIEAAWVAITYDPAMTKAYHEMKLKVGGKRAIIKIARKLLTRIRTIWIKNTLYEKGIA